MQFKEWSPGRTRFTGSSPVCRKDGTSDSHRNDFRSLPVGRTEYSNSFPSPISLSARTVNGSSERLMRNWRFKMPNFNARTGIVNCDCAPKLRRPRRRLPTTPRTVSWRCFRMNCAPRSPRFFTRLLSFRRRTTARLRWLSYWISSAGTSSRSRLIDDLLDVARIRNNKLQLHLEWADASDLPAQGLRRFASTISWITKLEIR